MLKLEILDINGDIKASQEGEDITLKYESKYQEGDQIRITLCENKFIFVTLDETLEKSIIYVPSGLFLYSIPFGDKGVAYNPEAWVGNEHVIKASVASKDDIKSYRNLALNSADKRGVIGYYPHAIANFVTRDEAVFEERNSIDGVIKNDCHGNYPYQSWGGGAREDLDYRLDFGRDVEVDKIVFYLRADFSENHDTYWKSLTIELSDGTIIDAEFEKTGQPQEIILSKKTVINSLHLTNFKQAANPLSWAALTQIEVYGQDIF